MTGHAQKLTKVGANSEVDSQRQAVTEFSCMNEKLDAFSKEIYEISKQEFSIISFEELINTMRNHVSEV